MVTIRPVDSRRIELELENKEGTGTTFLLTDFGGELQIEVLRGKMAVQLIDKLKDIERIFQAHPQIRVKEIV